MRSDLQPNVRTGAAFEGLLVKELFAGKLTWQGDTAKTSGKSGVEEWRLRYGKNEVLEPFASVEAWQKAEI